MEFYLSVPDHCLFIYLAWWKSTAKELTTWSSASAVLLYAALIVRVCFLFGVLV